MGIGSIIVTSHLEKRSFTLLGHRTSVALEPKFWDELQTHANANGIKVIDLVAAADRQRAAGNSLASSLRLLVLDLVKASNTTTDPKAAQADPWH